MARASEESGFYFQWHITEACNLKCRHCYQEDTQSVINHMSILYKTVDIMSSALVTWKKKGRVSITGGEPLLYPEEVGLLLGYIEGNNNFSAVSILTNGTLVTEDLTTELSKYKKIREIQVSIDGYNSAIHDRIRGKGAFDRAISGIKLLLEHNISVAIMFTLNKLNMNQLSAVLDLANEVGVQYLTIERYTPMGKSDKDALTLIPTELRDAYRSAYMKWMQMKQEGSKLKLRTSRPLWHLINDSLGGFCPVGYSCLTIMPDGTVYPCRRLPIDLGNLYKDGLYKIWYTSPVLWSIRRKNRMDSECGNCKDLYQCGGCRAAAYAVNRDYLGKDPLCWKGDLNA